jgi:hypothetical protein
MTLLDVDTCGTSSVTAVTVFLLFITVRNGNVMNLELYHVAGTITRLWAGWPKNSGCIPRGSRDMSSCDVYYV